MRVLPVLLLVFLLLSLPPVAAWGGSGTRTRSGVSGGNSFTLRIGKLTMTNVSNLFEMLFGTIKSKNVTMENLVIEVPQGEGTLRIEVGSATSPYAVMKVSILQVLGLAITHLSDLIPLLLGKSVTWTDVTIVANSMQAENLLISNQLMYVRSPDSSRDAYIEADRMTVSSLSVEKVVKESDGRLSFLTLSSGMVMENFLQKTPPPRCMCTSASRASCPGQAELRAVSIFSPRVWMNSMEITDRPHKVRARGVELQSPEIWATYLDLSSLDLENMKVFPC
jgi:hypothetical protein